MGTGGSFPGGKWQGREADHSPPTSADFNKTWIYSATPVPPINSSYYPIQSYPIIHPMLNFDWFLFYDTEANC
jgi:hypothetical protein